MLLSALGLHQKGLVDVDLGASIGKGGVKHQSIKLLVTSHGLLKMNWLNSLHTVLLGKVARKFQNFDT